MRANMINQEFEIQLPADTAIKLKGVDYPMEELHFAYIVLWNNV